jgi:hypothetical protein
LAFKIASLSLFAAGAIVCCTDEDCPFPADSCSAQCATIDGSELDRAQGCRRSVVLGCTEPGTRTTDAVCHSDPASGRLVITTGDELASKPGWRQCNPTEASEIVGKPLCGP